ncbi:MAG: hypothetical protein ACO2PN_24900 [Pyrobaculum sp.]|jgi:hypothetical protein
MVLRPRAVVVTSRLTAERVRRVREDVYVIPFGLRLEDYLKYRVAGEGVRRRHREQAGAL